MEFLLNLIFSKYVALLATFTSIFIFIKSILPEEEQVLAAKRLGVDSEKKEYSHGIFKLASYLFPLILPLVSSLKIDQYRKKMANKLLIANLRSEFNPDEFMCFKIIMGFFFATISLYFYGITEEQIPYWKIPFAFVIGFFVPNLMLRSIIKKRQNAITRQLTFVIDLLTLSVEAGLDFVASIVRITEKARGGPLIDELKIMLKEIKLGITRSDALANLSGRIQLQELSSFTTVLIQADQLGASIGPVLRTQSDLLRAQRFQKAEKKGAEASQKILLPLVFFILPTIIIVIFGPIILERIYGP